MVAATDNQTRLKLLVVGVGGQGVLTAARFLGDAALRAKLPVVVGQLHGMSQRGGSVECSVIIGPSQSSFIGNGEADVVLGMEPLEVLRALPKIGPRTRVVVNLGHIVPFSLAIQGVAYPSVEDTLNQVRQRAGEVYPVNCPELVHQVGVSRTLNVIMLGAAAALGVLPFDHNLLWQTVEQKSKAHFVESNRLAYQLGFAAVNQNPEQTLSQSDSEQTVLGE